MVTEINTNITETWPILLILIISHFYLLLKIKCFANFFFVIPGKIKKRKRKKYLPSVLNVLYSHLNIIPFCKK